MHQALYRKYRPCVFDDVYGQEHITSILKQEAKSGQVSHAYLFSGSRGTGKTTCAKILAKVVNCLHPIDGNPCNECENCRSIDEGTSTDVLEVDAASATGVDNIRDIKEKVIYPPSMLKKRVYIIDEAHMLSISASNALLKTIEEPPEHVLFIFATTEPHKLPATIISRCQRFDFRRISNQNIVDRLKFISQKENIDLTDDGASVIAKQSQGGMRDAISLLELCAGTKERIDSSLVNEIFGTSSYESICNIAKNVANKNYGDLFKAVNDIVISSNDLLVFISDLTSLYRDMAVYKALGNESFLDLLPLEYQMLKDVSSLYTMSTILYHTSLLDSAYLTMMKNPQGKRLTAEITLMKMCEPKLSYNNDAILSRLSELEDKVTLLSKGIQPIKKEVISERKNDKKDSASNIKSLKDPVEYIGNWNDCIAKCIEKKPSFGVLLQKTKCFYSVAKNKFFIETSNKMLKSILSDKENGNVLFNTMLLCDIPISFAEQIDVLETERKSENSLDELL